jgi:hypothetical protein
LTWCRFGTQRFAAIARLRDRRDAGQLGEEREHAGAHQRVIVRDQESDEKRESSSRRTSFGARRRGRPIKTPALSMIAGVRSQDFS